MSDYKREMMDLVIELMERATESNDMDVQDKLRRQATVLEFIIRHPEGFIANIKANEVSESND